MEEEKFGKTTKWRILEFALVFSIILGGMLYTMHRFNERDNTLRYEEIISDEVINILVENEFASDTLIIYLKSGRVLEINNTKLLYKLQIGESYTFKITEYESGRISVEFEKAILLEKR